jgi:hypothetical protein
MNKDDEDGDARRRGEDEKYGCPSGCICTASTSAMVERMIEFSEVMDIGGVYAVGERPNPTLPPPQGAQSKYSRVRHAIQSCARCGGRPTVVSECSERVLWEYVTRGRLCEQAR